jgi:hypothetical protein
MSAPTTRLPLAPAGGGAASGPVERMQPGDVLCDYTLVPYDPVRSPDGKLRSVNLLFESFAHAGVEDLGRALVDGVRAAVGPFRTVFGVKAHAAAPDAPSWELYFYDPRRVRRELAIERLADALRPHLAIDARPPHPLPWHMFSVEVDAAALRERVPVAVDVYVSTSPHAKGTDRSYKLRGAELLLENTYSFHRPELEIDEILHRIRSSVHFRRGVHNLAAILPPELLDCAHVCVANKRRADAVYFSRVTLEQAIFAVGFFRLGEALGGWLRDRAAELDHLLWDVGVDYVGDGDALRVVKGGVYGSF